MHSALYGCTRTTVIFVIYCYKSSNLQCWNRGFANKHLPVEGFILNFSFLLPKTKVPMTQRQIHGPMLNQTFLTVCVHGPFPLSGAVYFRNTLYIPSDRKPGVRATTMPFLHLGHLFLKINCISIIKAPIFMTFLQTHILPDQCYITYHHGAASNCFTH